MSDDPIGDALRAEAEQAREEIRAAGIACPSCGVNMADLPEGHQLAMESMPTGQVQCADGRRVLIASVDMFRAAANVGLYDEMRNNIWDLDQPARLIYPPRRQAG